MKRLFYTFIFILFFCIYNIWYWEGTSCEYSSKIQQCLNTQNPRTISDFVCISWWFEDVAYQVVLDWEFKKIDKQIDQYLDWLDKSKWYYFWVNKKKPFTNAVDDIEYYLWVWGVFAQKYKKLCNWEILSKVIDCSLWWKTANIYAKDYLNNNDNSSKCILMYKLSLQNYRDTAYLILQNNKAKVQKDNNKSFMQKLRKKFDNLLDLIMVNIWYLERIWAKWQSKTKNPN